MFILNNNNNNEVYYHNNKSYKAKFVGDTKSLEICFNASICFCLSLFNILCMDGIAECMYLLLYDRIKCIVIKQLERQLEINENQDQG